MFAVALAPTASDAQPILPDDPEFEAQMKAGGRPPRVLIMGSNNITVLQTFQCAAGDNIGTCLNTTLDFNGGSFTGTDVNRIAALIAGRARVGSTLGSLAVLNTNYSYDNLYLEGDVKLRAQE